jgi:hypothetical protein
MLELTLNVALHTALGVALAGVVWVVGLGYLRALTRGRTGREDAVDAYPLGLLAVTLYAVLVLLEPWLGLLAAALVLAPMLGLLRDRGELGALLRPLAGPFLWALPAVAGFPIVLGILLHGPDEERDSRAFGDMFFYVNKLVSAADSLIPFRDLLAEGQNIIYVEGGLSFIGAMLSHLPGLDPVLFHTSVLPAFLLSSLCIGLALFKGDASWSMREAAFWPVVLALLLIAMMPYPTWLAESPPLAVSLPLTFSLYRLWADERMELTGFVVLGSVLALDLLLTKVVAAIPLGVLVVFALYRRYRGHPSFRRIAVVVGAGLAIAATLMIVLLVLTASWYARLFRIEFFPAEAAEGLWSQLDTRSTQEAAPTLTIVGEILLLAAVLRARHWPIAAALGIGLAASWLLGGQAFDGAIGTANLLAALFFWRRRDLFREQAWLILAAALVLAASVWFREIYGVRAGLVLLVLFGLALLPAVAVRLRRVAFALAAASLVALAGAWSADVRLTQAAVTLTPADYDIWERVNEIVPDDGLVFTTMTGRRITPQEGWNNYPSIAGRQLYLAGWYDGRLTSDRDEVDRRLALNAEVLSGNLAPAELDLSRSYTSYFAVTRRADRVPPSFRLLYANRDFSLYRVPS